MKYVKEQTVYFEIENGRNKFSATINSMQVLTYILTAVMIIVLCIALGNLNVVLFDSRKNEITILYSIGFTKRKLACKMWEENLFVSVMRYLLGILLTMSIISLLNAIYLVPNGKVLEIFSYQGLILYYILIFGKLSVLFLTNH